MERQKGKFDRAKVLIAWKKFVNKGIIDEGKVRPEVARSWVRCAQYGVDPWSHDFPACDNEAMKRSREKNFTILNSSQCIMRYMMTALNSNISLADMEGFVYDLISPFSDYQRTFGTYASENIMGTGNVGVCLFEKKPIRIDGFEHYRVASQGYSGVSAPIYFHGKMTGVLNINNPLRSLPSEALDICIEGSRLISLMLESKKQDQIRFLSVASFFDRLIDVTDYAVIVADQDGMILNANRQGKLLVPGYEEKPYASQSIAGYLQKKSSLFAILEEQKQGQESQKVVFKATKSTPVQERKLLWVNEVILLNGMIQKVLVFDSENASNAREKEKQPKLPLRRKEGEKFYIGSSQVWKEVDETVKKVAGYRSNVLILGETGTGKEVVAQTIHRLSGREGAFVPLNCGAIPKDLLASELFGYEGGAFTGAKATGAVGKFEYAHKGTLFLDEIGEMPVDMQVSLLRVLQEQTVTRIGGNKQQRFDVRIVAATNQNISQMIADKLFRSDLFYRLSVIEIHLPRLAERGDDVILLAEHFNQVLSQTLQVRRQELSREVVEFLKAYSWPGNVRELKNVIEKVLIVANGRQIQVKDFPRHMRDQAEKITDGGKRKEEGPGRPEDRLSEDTEDETLSPKEKKDKKQREQVARLMEKHMGNLSRVAEDMGISRNTLYRKMERWEIEMKVTIRPKKK